MFQEKCRITENKRVAAGHFVLTMVSRRISRVAKPGQFVQILCSGSLDPLLPRPFSFLDVKRDEITILYAVVGRGTALLEKMKKGEELQVVGPLGNGFGLTSSLPSEFVLVGGGVGIPPLYHWAKELIKKKKLLPGALHVFLGARTKSLLLCERDFKKLGVDLRVATDDGSKGKKGFVTAVFDEYLQRLQSVRVYACGPTPMLKAVSALSEKHGVPCEVSVEVPMACGFGACLGCAIKVKKENAQSHRFAIACCEGPVFMGDQILWD
jgi:dihydroorotate dehydrogenase electron transfer subunit